MKKYFWSFILGMSFSTLGISQTKLTHQIAEDLSKAPLTCIPTEFPNKTSHLADAPSDARLLPSELHPVFYGCLDWHSSVHGHWMLVKILQLYPNLSNKDAIVGLLNQSFQLEKMQAEAEYFGKYTASNGYERTYGWAWLLKLDETLADHPDPQFKEWRAALQPLTQKIVNLWKAYLPKQTYPNRTGVHNNTAFGLDFALDWARKTMDTAFEQAIVEKAKHFYLKNSNIPGYLEPDGSDFFSPSLQAAQLISKILDDKAFLQWFEQYYSKESLANICKAPTVSDRNDYQIVHLDGLSFSRAWCMKNIAKKLPAEHPTKVKFETTAQTFLDQTLPHIFHGYGGEHWLASFAIYAFIQ